MKKSAITGLLVLIAVLSHGQLKRNVLFLGNSYTYVNDLPQLIKNIALSKGDTLESDQITPGGYTFQNHFNNPATYTKLKQGKWDAVVIQGQSQEPSFSPTEVMSYSYPYAKALCDSVRKYGACTEVIFYMTWGRKNGDAANCAAYPPVCTFDGMNARLRESYLMFADSFNASCAPVGVAWKKFRNQYPLVELYNLDESHPSLEGSYLAACVFYSAIFKKDVNGAGYYSSVNSTVAQNIQSVAGTTVIDSTSVWNQNSHLPVAAFSYSLISENNFQFTNQSVNANGYNWSFGSTLPSPQFQFPAGTSVSVTLTAQNSCTTNSISKSLLLTVIPKENHCEPRIYNTAEHLKVLGCTTANKAAIFIYDANGKLVGSYQFEGQATINISFLSPGIYLGRYQDEMSEMEFKILR